MSRINLIDDADTIAQKFRKARTDPEPLPDSAEGLDARPEAKNLVAIYAALADESVAQVLGQYAGQGFGAFKPALADLAVEKLGPIAARLRALQDDRGELDRLLALGAERARAIAAPTLAKAYTALGL